MEILTQEQAEKFHRDGYLRFGRVIGSEEVDRLRAALDRIIAEELARTSDEGLPPEFAYGHDWNLAAAGKGDRAIHQFVNMWKVAPEYREIIHNPAITAAVRDLMGVREVQLWHDQVISKPPGENKKFAFHHDFYFWPLDRPRMISCWLALDHATVENGCMHVIPGSHRDPRYQPVDCELLPELNLAPAQAEPGDPASLYAAVRTWDHDRAVPVELEAGECMFHHCLNYHMTPQNTTSRQRRAFVMIFMPPDTRFKRSQSPHHPCTSYLDLQDGDLMPPDYFPRCG